MKKLLLILLAIGMSIYIAPLVVAQTPDGTTPAEESVCDGLEGAAYGLCVAYCEAQDCDLVSNTSQDTQSCQSLRKNYAKKTGGAIPPCDVPVACCICSSGGQNPAGQVCEEIPLSQCIARQGLPIGAPGQYGCAQVSCPLATDKPSCLLPVNNQFNVIPNYINGISDTCLPFGRPEPPCPRGPRLCTFLGGVLVAPLPGVPKCP